MTPEKIVREIEEEKQRHMGDYQECDFDEMYKEVERLRLILRNAQSAISDLISGEEYRRIKHERDEMEKKYIEMRYEYMASACDRAQLRGENNDK